MDLFRHLSKTPKKPIQNRLCCVTWFIGGVLKRNKRRKASPIVSGTISNPKTAFRQLGRRESERISRLFSLEKRKHEFWCDDKREKPKWMNGGCDGKWQSRDIVGIQSSLLLAPARDGYFWIRGELNYYIKLNRTAAVGHRVKRLSASANNFSPPVLKYFSTCSVGKHDQMTSHSHGTKVFDSCSHLFLRWLASLLRARRRLAHARNLIGERKTEEFFPLATEPNLRKYKQKRIPLTRWTFDGGNKKAQ